MKHLGLLLIKHADEYKYIKTYGEPGLLRAKSHKTKTNHSADDRCSIPDTIHLFTGSQDLSSLVEAYIDGRLPQLKHLDISENERLVGQLRLFAPTGQKWDALETLNIKQGLELGEDFQALIHPVQSGVLSNVRNLSVSTGKNDGLKICTDVQWPNIRQLEVFCATGLRLNHHVVVLRQIVEGIEKNFFPKLRILLATSPKKNTITGAFDPDDIFEVVDDTLLYDQEALKSIYPEMCLSSAYYSLARRLIPKREEHSMVRYKSQEDVELFKNSISAFWVPVEIFERWEGSINQLKPLVGHFVTTDGAEFMQEQLSTIDCTDENKNISIKDTYFNGSQMPVMESDAKTVTSLCDALKNLPNSLQVLQEFLPDLEVDPMNQNLLP